MSEAVEACLDSLWLMLPPDAQARVSADIRRHHSRQPKKLQPEWYIGEIEEAEERRAIQVLAAQAEKNRSVWSKVT